MNPESVHRTLGKYMLTDGYDIVLDLAKSDTTHLWDSRRGRRFLDFFSYFATAPLGNNHPKMMGFLERLGRLAVNNPSNSDFYTPEMAEFVQTFADLAMPSSMKHLFFIAGGGLAVENALKTSFDWKARKNMDRGPQEGLKIIHFKEAFHGRTGYTMSLTNVYDQRKTKYFTKFDWPRITNPKITFPLEENIEIVERLESQALEEIDRALESCRDECAALIIEPIQGEGGDNHFRGEFLRALRRLCDENELMYIIDEVQTGVGLTGKLWCYQHFGFEPDIICFGKKTQVCGIMVSERVDEVEDNVFNEPSRLNSTWGGNLIDMVRAKRYLEIIEEEKLVDNAARMGDLMLRRVKELDDGSLSNIRGRGLMIAFDLPDGDARGRLSNRLYELGMIAPTCGERSIRFRPPLCIQEEDVDEGMEILEKGLKSL
jgi:L-lysine 6-transaminase